MIFTFTNKLCYKGLLNSLNLKLCLDSRRPCERFASDPRAGPVSSRHGVAWLRAERSISPSSQPAPGQLNSSGALIA